MKRYSLIAAILLIFYQSIAAQVGIGTTTPHPGAILDVRSTSKGIVFPSMTSAQRDAISNPPDGLHLYNKDERCLNVFDSTFATWSCYCEMDTCKAVLIRISSNTSAINFNTTYANAYPWARKFTIVIDPGVIISNGITFTMPSQNTYKIKIINRGGIYGTGGGGGQGASGQAGSCQIAVSPGQPGGHAIWSTAGLKVVIDNYGIIAGGGGGGGGGGRVNTDQYGGGGGGGAGSNIGTGGTGGGTTFSGTFIPCHTNASIAQSGTPGTINSAGTGGAGYNGGGMGGNGGGLAQAGTQGTGAGAPAGGAPGKAVFSPGGPSLFIINNLAGGQVFGVVD
jgi:hypothetical protein